MQQKFVIGGIKFNAPTKLNFCDNVKASLAEFGWPHLAVVYPTFSCLVTTLFFAQISDH